MPFVIILLKYVPHSEPPPIPVNWTLTGIGLGLGLIALLWISTGGESKNEYVGCIPGILLVAAGILLLPLITWICLAVNAVIGIGIILFVAVGILYTLFGRKK